MSDEIPPPEASCARCGCDDLAWERTLDEFGERLLGVCQACGWLRAVDPAYPQVEFADPLTTFLLGSSSRRRDPQPPWRRLITITAHEPWQVRWQDAPSACPACGSTDTRHAGKLPKFATTATVCVGCGWTLFERFTIPACRRLACEGTTWEPRCEAVVKLREAIFIPGFSRDWSLPDEHD